MFPSFGRITRYLGRRRCMNLSNHDIVGTRTFSITTSRTIIYRRSFSNEAHQEKSHLNNDRKIGLFSIPDLNFPDDFQRLTKKAIQESDNLRNKIPESILSQNQARETLYQLDQISRAVCNVIDAAELCRSAHADPQWREAANTAFAQLQDYIATLNTDRRLYNALVLVENYYYDDLSEEERRFCFLLKREFELDGIHLPDREHEQVRQLHNTVTTLESLFANNITNSHKQFWVDATSVESVIPKHVLQANGAIYGDTSRQQKQQVQLTVDTPITHSITSFASSEKLRKEVYMETMTSCPENLDVLDSMIDSRHQLALTLGFESYSHRYLQDKMVQSPKAVFDFLEDLQQRIQPAYQQDMTMLSRAKQQMEGNTKIEPWDVKFYVKLLKAQNGVDPDALAPYLSLSNCLNAMKMITSSLFGIRMEEMELDDGERWDIITEDNENDNSCYQRSSFPNKGEEIKKFVVWEEETGRELGTIYLDLHPRPGKYTHAAHFTVRCGCLENGPNSDYQKPIVALVCNMNTGQASFSSHQEVETFLHEFGHAMHSLLSRTNFQHLSGTRAAMDFVETPSHWMEHYAWCKLFLPILATNENGEPLPESMIQALSQSRNQFRFLEMQNQIVLSKFDQTIFGSKNKISTKDTWAAMHRQSGVPVADNTHWFTNIGHLVTYGAGYYGYLYSQVFADAIWNGLFHNQSLERSSGERIWKKMLIHGGARDASIMLEDLLGHKPTIDNYWKSLMASSSNDTIKKERNE